MGLYLDRIEGAGTYLSTTGNRARRIAIVEGVSTVDPALVTTLATQVAGMPQLGNAHPVPALGTLQSIDAESIPVTGDCVQVILDYATPTGNGIQLPGGGILYTIEDDSSLISETTQLVPGTDQRVPIEPKKFITTSSGPRYRADVGTITFQRPIRQLTISGKTQRVDELERAKAAFGKVNHATWQGLPAGYWLFGRLQSRTTGDDKWRQFTVSVMTKNTEDWSTYSILRDRETGAWVKVDDSVARNLSKAQYAHGQTFPNGENKYGIVKVGPYPTHDFFSIFGV